MIGSSNRPNMDDRTPPMTPQLALRVAMAGGVTLVLFAIIFFRLWFLQVLNSNEYAKAAVTNYTRHVPVAAPRGEILGLTGKPLVQSQPVPSVSISPTDLPGRITQTNFLKQPAQDLALYRRLAPILGISQRRRTCTVTFYKTGQVETYGHTRDIIRYSSGAPATITAGTAPLMSRIECLVAKSVAGSEYGNVTIKAGVSADVRAYIDEHQNQFEGVLAQQSYQRHYLLGEAGAQLFGYVGPLTAAEQSQKAFSGVNPSDSVGQAGLEYEYDQALRGTDGYDGVKVNSDNEFEGYAKGQAPVIGDNLKTSLSASLERVGQAALAHSVAVNALAGANGGAFVALDPQNGRVYAMGSDPTYNPSIFDHGLSAREWNYLRNPSNNYPLLNKAIQGAGPDGSTFKVITATAALQSGVWNVNDTYDDGGKFCIPGTNPNAPGDCVHNSGHEAGGLLNLISAFEMSDDDFFFNLGYKLRFNVATHPSGGELEQWARKYGLGEPTGIDLPDEVSGTVPSPKLFDELYHQQILCEHHSGVYKHHTGACQIADTNAWTTGDDLNTALGQGDVQVTPLQLAVAYSAIENGGKVVTPHIGQDVQTPDGTVVRRIDPAAKRQLDINPTYLDTIRQGLYYAANGGYGSVGATSSDVMGNFGRLKVYGKTGTAQYGTTAQTNAGAGSDYAWYACYVPSSETGKPIVVVVWVEKGGFGDVAAAPVARQILSQWFYGKPGPYVAGTSTTL